MRPAVKHITALVTGILLLSAIPAFCQDDLLGDLEKTDKKDKKSKQYSSQTFKGTRLVNGHTVETIGEGTLEFIFSHRFGRVNGGLYEMFGLDDAFVRIGLEYGITDKLGVGIGRNSVDKTVDGYLKYKALTQTKNGSPITITAFASTAYKTSPKAADTPEGFENIDRLAYTAQLLIARKFSPAISLQLMPSIVHKNYVAIGEGDNNQVAIGAGGRFKVTRSMSFSTEYYYRINPDATSPYRNSLGVGIEIETGGHVFQIVLTNTRGMVERTFITETDGKFFKGDIHLGFNVTRIFQLKKK